MTPATRKALEHYRAHRGLAAPARERVWARVEHSIADGEDLRLIGEMDRAPVTRIDRGRTAIRIAIVTLAAAAVLVLISRWGNPALWERETEVPRPAQAPDQRPVAPEDGQVQPSPAVEPAAPRSPALAPAPAHDEAEATDPAPVVRPPKPKSAAKQRGPADTSLAREMQLVRQARAALRSDDPSGALKALRRHATRFPRGQMAQEREALRVRALCESGAVRQAAAAAAAFKRAYPHSHHAGAIDGTCAAK